MSKVKVLFLCTGNSARSQMAEALLRIYGGVRFEAYSAGHEPKGINPLTTRVMEEIGINLTNHRSKNMDEYIGKIDFDYLISVCADADRRCPVFPGIGKRLRWFLDDPAAQTGSEEEKLDKFRRVRDQILFLVRDWVNEVGASPIDHGLRGSVPVEGESPT
jgi:arsenate reductase